MKTALYHLYLLQLDEYNVSRFQKTVRDATIPKEWRGKIDWTPKLLLVTLLAVFLYIGIPALLVHLFAAYSLFSIVLTLAAILMLVPYFYIFLILALYILQPLDTYAKQSVINRAVAKLQQYPDLKIIGIAGSYGKTTMKEVLASVLSQKYTVLKTPKNINTPLGISRQILKELDGKTEIYIVEMGEYYRGDIEAICKITPPDIAVVTGINEAHLEKMGSIDTTVNTIFEVVVNRKPGGMVLANKDSELVEKNWEHFAKKGEIELYSAGDKDVKLETFHEDGSGQTVTISGVGKVKVTVLGEYIVGDIHAAALLANELGVTHQQLKKGIEELQPVEHRLQPIYNSATDVMVIDDSYNGNPDGVEEAIKVLSKFKKRRKIYVTPGLVETGDRNEEIHYNIGKKLARVADKVILIKNSATPHIEKGLKENGFEEESVIWFDNAKSAHDSLSNIVKGGDVVLFQNDWPDNYI